MSCVVATTARSGATDGSMTAPLQVGSISNSYNRAEFHMIGSGVTADVRAVAPPTVTARTTPRSTVPIAEPTRIRFLTRPPVSFELLGGVGREA